MTSKLGFQSNEPYPNTQTACPSCHAPAARIALQRGLEQVLPPVEFDRLLALLDDRSNTCRRQNATESDTAGANAFCKRSLRHEGHVQATLEHQLLRLRVRADVAGDEAADEARRNQLSDAYAWPCRVIGDQGQIASALSYQFVDQATRGTDTHEAADHQARPIGDQRNSIGDRDGFSFHC